MARRVFPVLSHLRRLFPRTDGPHGARTQEPSPDHPSCLLVDVHADDLLPELMGLPVTDPHLGKARRLRRKRADIEQLILEQYRDLLDELSRRES